MRNLINPIMIFLLVLGLFSGRPLLAQADRGVKNITVERKIALVIGNTNYDNSIGKLTNPVNDARDIGDSLQRLDFTLIGGKPQLDVNRKQMLELIREFSRQIKAGGVGFFYFSGHGVQVNKENYIIPITDALVYEDDAETEAIKVDQVSKEMELAGNRLNILVLDACRNNGLQKRTRDTAKGLAEPARKPEGTFIAFSAGDGQTASDGTDKNGLFTQELLKNLETPNVRLDDIFRTTRNEVKRLSANRQIPVLFDSTSEAFILNTEKKKSSKDETTIVSSLPDGKVQADIEKPISKTSFNLFSLNDVNGIPRNFYELKGEKGTAVIFLSAQCPVDNAYKERINNLANTFKTKGINFIGLNPNATESIEMIKIHALQNYSFPMLIDKGSVIADQLDASSTPSVFLFDSSGSVVYKGMIDNDRTGKNVSMNFLWDALTALANGSPIEKKETKFFGCTIKRVL